MNLKNLSQNITKMQRNLVMMMNMVLLTLIIMNPSPED
jgi:hypothetical protein